MCRVSRPWVLKQSQQHRDSYTFVSEQEMLEFARRHNLQAVQLMGRVHVAVVQRRKPCS